jgi:hypothetical protein
MIFRPSRTQFRHSPRGSWNPITAGSVKVSAGDLRMAAEFLRRVGGGGDAGLRRSPASADVDREVTRQGSVPPCGARSEDVQP